MSTLLLRLAGPLQAWGDSSRFTRRLTRSEPTKSGILGMLAAAEGRRRTDPVEDLIALRFGVRTDQPGTVLRDFQTAIHPDSGKAMPLSERYYIADAVFVAGIEGPALVVERLAKAIQEPTYPLYLGRRSCVPSTPVFLQIVETSLEDALSTVPWQASSWYQTRLMGKDIDCALSIDRAAGELESSEDSHERVRDVPRTWDPRRRDYGWREVTHGRVKVHTTAHEKTKTTHHDPWGGI